MIITGDATRLLRGRRVHVSGTGRIGSAAVTHLAAAGVGQITANDPQEVEAEDIGSLMFVKRADVGRKKVFALERFLDGAPGLVFEAIPEPAESAAVDRLFEAADAVISCANTVEGRLAAERKAIRFRKPIVQAAAFDGRERCGGLVTVWNPGQQDAACFGCYMEAGARFPRGEILLPPVTSAVAGLAATIGIALLVEGGVCALSRNFFVLDFGAFSLRSQVVRRRNDCSLCGGNRA